MAAYEHVCLCCGRFLSPVEKALANYPGQKPERMPVKLVPGPRFCMQCREEVPGHWCIPHTPHEKGKWDEVQKRWVKRENARGQR